LCGRELCAWNEQLRTAMIKPWLETVVVQLNNAWLEVVTDTIVRLSGKGKDKYKNVMCRLVRLIQ
jgi:hypothetical protein